MTDAPITAAELEAMRRVHARATESTYKSVKHHLEDQDEWERMSRREWPRLMAEIERLRGMLETAMDYTEHDHQCYVDLGSPCTCRWAEEEPPIRAYLAAVGERDAICQECGQAVAAETDAMIAHECRDATP